MPFKGLLKVGKRYKITVASDPATPGMTAFAIGWVPPLGSAPTTPVVDTVAPGMTVQHAGIIPGSQMLVLDFDLPDAAASKIDVRVEQDTTVIADGPERGDTEWTFVVQP